MQKIIDNIYSTQMAIPHSILQQQGILNNICNNTQITINNAFSNTINNALYSQIISIQMCSQQLTSLSDYSFALKNIFTFNEAINKNEQLSKMFQENIYSSAYLGTISAFEQITNNLITPPLFSRITEISSVFSPYITQYEQIHIGLLDDDISVSDIYNVDILEDGSLTYEGETYSKEEIIKELQVENKKLQLELQEQKAKITELELQINQPKSENTLKKFDKLKKVCEIVKIIIWIKENSETIINITKSIMEYGKTLLK